MGFFDPSNLAASCDVIVGLQIVAVEHLNAENGLVKVLASKPALSPVAGHHCHQPVFRVQDYDLLLGDLTGTKDTTSCIRSDTTAFMTEGPDRGFTCWRGSFQSTGWPLTPLGVVSAPNSVRCRPSGRRRCCPVVESIFCS